MKSSFRILRVFGISVEFHITLVLFMLFLLPFAGYAGLFFFFTVFFFVLLHELSHSLVAKSYGVRVDRISLTFFGGIANAEIPEKPKVEFLMALAGPLLNFVAATLSFAAIHSLGLQTVGYTGVVYPEAFAFDLTHILHTILYVNLMLGLFNIVPGFPMDGGRLLRALLAFRMDYLKATQLSVSVGQSIIFPLIFIVGVVEGNIILVVIASVLFIASGSELRFVKLKKVFSGVTLGDLAVREVPKVDGSVLATDFISSLIRPGAGRFIVYGEGGRVLGVLDLGDLEGRVYPGSGARVSDYATRDFMVLESDEKVSDLLKELLSAEFVLVSKSSRVLGYLTPRILSESQHYYSLRKRIQ